MSDGTLLIIDDEPAMGALIRRAGEACRYDVVVASDAETFKGHFHAAAPDVICLDLAMPGMDGIEMLRFLARRQCRSRLLIISGFDRGTLARAVRLGEALGLHIAGVLPKPIRMAELTDLLSRLAAPDQPGGVASA
jgi:DNA-binding response OmpR family regulator